MNIFTKGLMIGFGIAAPIGQIGILCIRRSLNYGRLSGFLTGLGASVVDAFYGFVAAYGLMMLFDLFKEFEMALKIFGSLFIGYLGITTILQSTNFSPDALEQKRSKISLFKDFFSTLCLTLTSPITIFAFMGVFASLGIVGYENNQLALSMVSGIFFGSLVWWIILSCSVGSLRRFVSQKAMRIINIVAGIILITFGILVFSSIFFETSMLNAGH